MSLLFISIRSSSLLCPSTQISRDRKSFEGWSRGMEDMVLVKMFLQNVRMHRAFQHLPLISLGRVHMCALELPSSECLTYTFASVPCMYPGEVGTVMCCRLLGTELGLELLSTSQYSAQDCSVCAERVHWAHCCCLCSTWKPQAQRTL